MKKLLPTIILILTDYIGLCLSIMLAFITRNILDQYCGITSPIEISQYFIFSFLFMVVIILFYLLGVYSKRYDFWQELERLLKGLFFSIAIVLSILFIVKQSEEYSRFIIIVMYIYAAIILPLLKNFIKRKMFRIGIWKKEAKLVGQDPFFLKHVFSNPYLGYVPSKKIYAKTLFVSSSYSQDEIESILFEAINSKQEVIFIPAVKNYNFSDSHIIHLFNARANLISVENNLLKKTNRGIKLLFDYFISIVILPFLMIIIGVIALRIKFEDGGSVFYSQQRFGQNGEHFSCYKFRSMKENGDYELEKYLEIHPEERIYYSKFHKYLNDPRITKIGKFIRNTSLDELPQILNVLKGEMSLIGPRPYMLNEKDKIGKNLNFILAVKPGITGLWQVSGRSDIDFKSRIDIDMWYVRNWSIWSDVFILIKTVQTVLSKKGSY